MADATDKPQTADKQPDEVRLWTRYPHDEHHAEIKGEKFVITRDGVNVPAKHASAIKQSAEQSGFTLGEGKAR